MAANGLRKVLMLAYVFPPFFSTGGSIRVVKFIKFLSELGWRPVVVTIDDRKETVTQRKTGSASLLDDVPSDIRIYRTGTSGEPSVELIRKGREARSRKGLWSPIMSVLSAVRRFAISYVLLPDEQVAWLPFAVRLGRQVIRDENIDIIFATCPPHSVALAGALLKKLTGKRLVLDYRDDWIDTPFHRSKPLLVQWIERQMERRAIAAADRVILVTDWSRDAFVRRYPDQPPDKFVLIPNGCDLQEWARPGIRPHRTDELFTIVHAGLLSTAEDWKRDPEGFFEALRRIRAERADLGERLRVEFTGSLPHAYREMAARMGLGDVVRELGHLPLEELIARLKGADLLLAINYDDFVTLIPGKIYEYWAVGGPSILLLSAPGAAQSLLDRNGLGMTASPYDPNGIAQAIVTAYEQRMSGRPMRISTTGIEQYDRKALALRLANVLNELYESGQSPRVVEGATA